MVVWEKSSLKTQMLAKQLYNSTIIKSQLFLEVAFFLHIFDNYKRPFSFVKNK